MLPLLPPLPKQIEKLKLLLREELGKPPPLNRGLNGLDNKLRKDDENKQLLVKKLLLIDEEPNRKLLLIDEEPNRKLLLIDEEPNRKLLLIDEEPNRKLPLIDEEPQEQSKFVESLVEFAEPLEGLKSPGSVEFVELLRKLENLDLRELGVALNELSEGLENLDLRESGVDLRKHSVGLENLDLRELGVDLKRRSKSLVLDSGAAAVASLQRHLSSFKMVQLYTSRILNSVMFS
jgi:hypothetical protein